MPFFFIAAYDLSALIEKMDTLEFAELDITLEQMF